MQDKPSAVELLGALKAFIDNEARDQLSERSRFNALVASNVCGIVAREIELGEANTRAETARLKSLLRNDESHHRDDHGAHDADKETPITTDGTLQVEGLNRELCRAIESGRADAGPWRHQVFSHLRQTLRERLSVDSPRFAAKVKEGPS